MKEQPQKPAHGKGLILLDLDTMEHMEIHFYKYEEAEPYISHLESENRQLQERVAELEKEIDDLIDDTQKNLSWPRR